MNGDRDRHRRLYTAIPATTCAPDGSDRSGPAPRSPREAERLGIAGAVTTFVHPSATRGAFLIDGRCAAHERRPFVGRVAGTAAALPCPHGRGPQDRVIPLAERVARVTSPKDGCPSGRQSARRRAVRDVVARDGTTAEFAALDTGQRLGRAAGIARR